MRQRMCTDRTPEVTFLDAAELDLPLLDKMYKEYPKGEAPPTLQGAESEQCPARSYCDSREAAR